MDEEPPDPPAGYASPRRIEYPTGMLLLGSIAIALLAAGGYGVLLAAFHDGVIVLVIDDSNLWRMLGPFLVAIAVTVVVHELLHGVAFRLLGYDVEYGVVPSQGVFYTATIGQFQRREDLFPVALAPLAIITVAALPFLAVPIPAVAWTAFLVLLINTSGAIGDVYMSVRLWRMPPGTLLYDVDLQRMYAYHPAD